MNIKRRFFDWFNNYPLEALEYSGEDFLYLKLDKDLEIEKSEIVKKDMIDTDKNYLLNLGLDTIKYYIIDLEKIAENKESEKQLIEWKLKNKLSNIKLEDYIFEYNMIDKTKALVFLIIKSDIKKIDDKISIKNMVFNLDIAGIYNYYKDSFSNDKKTILLASFEKTTYLIFVNNDNIVNIRFFRLGIEEYIKAENIEGNIISKLEELSKKEHIPATMDLFFEQENFENFEKIKKINQKWMMGIEAEIKEEISKKEYDGYEIVLGAYENVLQNIELILEEYIGIKVRKADVEIKDLPFLSLMGNLYKWHK